MNEEVERKPRQASPLVVFAAILFGCVLLLEGASWIGWFLIEGERYSYKGALELRESATSASLASPALEPAPPPDQELDEGALRYRGQVLHPFLGYVFTPEYNETAERQGKHLEVGGDGFWRLAGASPPDEEAVTVGVFGGSVAFLFSFQGAEVLSRELSQELGRPVAVESWALAGYKQPQQLMTLTWLLALDRAPDIVINLDGFNDLVLPIAENLSKGTNPYFPRAWETRVRELPDVHFLNLVGEASFHERRRTELATALPPPLFRRSVTWHLVWRWRDLRAQGRIADVRFQLLNHEPESTPYVAQGPPYKAHHLRGAGPDVVAFWSRSSVQMARLAEGSSLRYYHFLQPSQFVEGAKPMSVEEESVAFGLGSPYGSPAKAGYSLLRQEGDALRAEGVQFFDMTQAFAEVEEPLYIDSCCHFNARGNEILAEAIAKIVREDLATNPL